MSSSLELWRFKNHIYNILDHTAIKAGELWAKKNTIIWNCTTLYAEKKQLPAIIAAATPSNTTYVVGIIFLPL